VKLGSEAAEAAVPASASQGRTRINDFMAHLRSFAENRAIRGRGARAILDRKYAIIMIHYWFDLASAQCKALAAGDSHAAS